jgi:hypothetical protein
MLSNDRKAPVSGPVKECHTVLVPHSNILAVQQFLKKSIYKCHDFYCPSLVWLTCTFLIPFLLSYHQYNSCLDKGAFFANKNHCVKKISVRIGTGRYRMFSVLLINLEVKFLIYLQQSDMIHNLKRVII